MVDKKKRKDEEEKHTEKGTQLQSNQMQEAQGNMNHKQVKSDKK